MPQDRNKELKNLSFLSREMKDSYPVHHAELLCSNKHTNRAKLSKTLQLNRCTKKQALRQFGLDLDVNSSYNPERIIYMQQDENRGKENHLCKIIFINVQKLMADQLKTKNHL